MDMDNSVMIDNRREGGGDWRWKSLERGINVDEKQ